MHYNSIKKVILKKYDPERRKIKIYVVERTQKRKTNGTLKKDSKSHVDKKSLTPTQETIQITLHSVKLFLE